MRNKIVGLIGIVFGGLILVNAWLSNPSVGSQAYQNGQLVGVAFGALFCIAGVYTFFKKSSEN